jgi:hypothetical protein
MSERGRSGWEQKANMSDLDFLHSGGFRTFCQISRNWACFSSSLLRESREWLTWVALQENESWSPLDLLHPLFQLSNPFEFLIFLWVQKVLQNKSDWCREMMMMIHPNILWIIIIWGIWGLQLIFDKLMDFRFFFELAPYIRVWEIWIN